MVIGSHTDYQLPHYLQSVSVFNSKPFFSRPSPKAGRELQTALDRIRDDEDEKDP